MTPQETTTAKKAPKKETVTKGNAKAKAKDNQEKHGKGRGGRGRGGRGRAGAPKKAGP